MRRRGPTRGRINVERLSRKCVSLKVGYATRAAALDASEVQMLEGRVEPGCHLMPYECDQCREWHLRNQQIVPVPGRRGHRKETETDGRHDRR